MHPAVFIDSLLCFLLVLPVAAHGTWAFGENLADFIRTECVPIIINDLHLDISHGFADGSQTLDFLLFFFRSACNMMVFRTEGSDGGSRLRLPEGIDKADVGELIQCLAATGEGHGGGSVRNDFQAG